MGAQGSAQHLQDHARAGVKQRHQVSHRTPTTGLLASGLAKVLVQRGGIRQGHTRAVGPKGPMAQSAPLIDFYEELTLRQVDAISKQGFLSDAVTLLETVKKLSSSDEYMVLALNEEKDAPYENLDPDM